MTYRICGFFLATCCLAGAAFAQRPPAPIKPEDWRKQFGPNEVIQRVRPVEFKGYLANPHRGTQTFQRFNGDPLYPTQRWNDAVAPLEFPAFTGNILDPNNGPDYPRTTISYCRWAWAVIEPEKGKYRWDVIDGALKAAHDRGQALAVRLQPHVGVQRCPAWFFAISPPTERDSTGPIPDANTPQYIEHWTALIRAFGQRYDGHPDLESFDVAYAGACGETGGNATDATAEKLVDAYLEGFKKTQLVAMLGTHGSKYAISKRKDIGWRVDSFGDITVTNSPEVPPGTDWNHMYEAYPRALVLCGAEDAWKTAPITLETGGTVGGWKRRGLDIDYILAWGLRNHCSVFMPKSCAIPDELRAKIEDFSNRIGYRFALRQVTFPLEAHPGDPIQFDVYVDNLGCAPIYRDYKLALRFTQGQTVDILTFAQDIRGWLPGQKWFTEKPVFPKSLTPGIVKIDTAIVDPATNKPVVRFAAEGYGADGWLPLRYMDVLPPAAK